MKSVNECKPHRVSETAEVLKASSAEINTKLVREILSYTNWNSIKKILKGKSIDFIDFFSGVGGLTYGFHSIAVEADLFNLIGAFDIDQHANKTYIRNFGFAPSNLDLSSATIDQIKSCLKTDKLKKWNPLIILGGPPCQGFSAHKKKDPRLDPRNSLLARFAEISVKLDAELIITENVPDLLGKKHWHHYQAFQSTLEKGGYHIAADILNMAEYGVPQERFRAVIIASKHFVPTLPEPQLSRRAFRTVRDAIGALPPLEAGGFCKSDQMHITSRHRKETVDLIKRIPKNGGSRPAGMGPPCLDRVKGFYDVYGRLSWDRPAVTITARCRTPSCGRFVHPEQDRGLSVREAALLQGFPPSYIFEGPFDDKFKQIGNAVPPIFSLHLAAHVLSMLAGKNRGEAGCEKLIREPLFDSYSGVIAGLKRTSHIT
ncbi:MAG: DNA cytosine methyltransferase [Thermodesulfobacteriota bacterium]|jgi:DNA (cytosine-5)-methyltransferase 1|nr:MAG: DNA cytosine methyltransferase [Thermodesulfobacteriota bacterium]